MIGDEDGLLRLHLRVVGVGLVTTAMALAAVLVFVALPGHGEIRTGLVVSLVAIAGGASVAVALLPWKELFRRGAGLRLLYVWSLADIVLVSMAIAVSGGARSELFLMYVLITAFFGSVYRPRPQVMLLLATFACYLGALAWAGEWGGPGFLALRLSTLTILTVLTGYVSAELRRQTDAQTSLRHSTERWADVMGAVAQAGHSLLVGTADPRPVALRAMRQMGFERAAVCALQVDRASSVTRVDSDPENEPLPADVVSRLAEIVATAGEVVLLDWHDDGEVTDHAAGSDATLVVAAPVWVEGWLGGMLVGVVDRVDSGGPDHRSLELLASQLGLAIENVRRLEAADRAKAEFLSHVSHELRTPLTVIKGTGITLEHEPTMLDEATRRQLLSALNANVRVLEGLIAEVLDASRLAAEGDGITRAPVCLSDLVERTASRLGYLFSGLDLHLDVQKGLMVLADPLLIERAVENLLANAAKYSTVGRSVWVAARRSGPDVVVEIRDQGPGIPPDDLDRLGEPFYRGRAEERPIPGMGLGLTLVCRILEHYDSELEVESSVGSGTVFRFRLPSAGGSRIDPTALTVGQGTGKSSREPEAREARGRRAPSGRSRPRRDPGTDHRGTVPPVVSVERRTRGPRLPSILRLPLLPGAGRPAEAGPGRLHRARMPDRARRSGCEGRGQQGAGRPRHAVSAPARPGPERVPCLRAASGPPGPDLQPGGGHALRGRQSQETDTTARSVRRGVHADARDLRGRSGWQPDPRSSEPAHRRQPVLRPAARSHRPSGLRAATQAR